MNIEKIIVKWLKENNYDGLCSPSCECGCLIEDLVPCFELANLLDCEPGYRRNVKASEKCGCDGEGDDHREICPSKPLTTEQIEPQSMLF